MWDTVGEVVFKIVGLVLENVAFFTTSAIIENVLIFGEVAIFDRVAACDNFIISISYKNWFKDGFTGSAENSQSQT